MAAFVEFLLEPAPFAQLSAVVARLAEAKQAGSWPDDDVWLEFFDENARRRFWWPTPDELKAWEQAWFSTPPEKRASDPTLQRPWDFGSMLDALRHAEIEILGLRAVSPTTHRFEFEPYAYPYGGTGCIRALIESFGGQVTREVE